MVSKFFSTYYRGYIRMKVNLMGDFLLFKNKNPNNIWITFPIMPTKHVFEWTTGMEWSKCWQMIAPIFGPFNSWTLRNLNVCVYS